MVIVDANVLLYAVNTATMHHDVSRAWLDRALAGTEVVGLPWLSLVAFLRIATNRRAVNAPLSVDEAADQVTRWLDEPAAVIAEPTTRHAAILTGLLRDTGTAGNLVNDAHLAALAIEHGAQIVSHDRDFARFAGVRHRLPA
ncbi:MAG: type II toxin-antitoxin system VapC family toxin [Solirubrobacterales bacterium]|nr:type II toxin-antitoxin system VapC family toxin [Solirubrobacterales bacterium]